MADLMAASTLICGNPTHATYAAFSVCPRGAVAVGTRLKCSSMRTANTDCTELRKSLCTWFGEFCSCFCLPLLPQLAYNILATTYEDFFSPLYFETASQRRSALSSRPLLYLCPTTTSWSVVGKPSLYIYIESFV